MLANLTPVLLLIAFILLLQVSLSVPIIKTIFLFKLSAHVRAGIIDSGVSGHVKFGAWGYCISPVQVSIVGIDKTTAGECSKAALGYTFDETVASALRVSGLENLISRTLTAVLVLHPIACALTFLALTVSIVTLLKRRNSVAAASRISALVTMVLGGLAALLTTIVFLIDVSLVAIVRRKVNNSNLTLTWGNAVWMALGATILLWFSVVGACCGVIAIRRQRKTETY